MPLTVKAVAIDLLSKLGIVVTDPSTADAIAQQDCVIAINGAMQMLQTAGQDFFAREIISVNLIAGSSYYSIAKTIQAVLGPIRWNNLKPLTALESRGELDQYDRIFGGDSSYGAGQGDPEAYWVQNLKSGTAGDINQVNIWIVPVPNAIGTLAVEVVNDASAIVVANLTATTELPVAQDYTESVFLPIARMLITRSYLFSRPDILAGITQDYQIAMQTLGYKGGFPNAVQPEPTREVSA